MQYWRKLDKGYMIFLCIVFHNSRWLSNYNNKNTTRKKHTRFLVKFEFQKIANLVWRGSFVWGGGIVCVPVCVLCSIWDTFLLMCVYCLSEMHFWSGIFFLFDCEKRPWMYPGWPRTWGPSASTLPSSNRTAGHHHTWVGILYFIW